MLANEAQSDLFANALTRYTGSFTNAFRPAVHLFDGTVPAPFIYRMNGGPGVSNQFIMDADVPAPQEFNPGLETLLGQANVTDADVITADKFLVAHTKLPIDQNIRSHFADNVVSTRGARHAGIIARYYDRRIVTLACKNCREPVRTKNGLNVHNGGLRLVRGGNSSTYATALAAAYPRSSAGAANIIEDLRRMARACDENDWPISGRWVMLSTYLREVLQFAGAEVWSKDYYDVGGLGMREVPTIAGFKVAGYLNHMPSTASATNGGPLPFGNVTAAYTASTGTKYEFDARPATGRGTPMALFWCDAPDLNGGGVGLINQAGPIQVYKYFEETMSFLAYTAFLIDMDQMLPYLNASIELSSDATTQEDIVTNS
jgi:hypothetical protein